MNNEAVLLAALLIGIGGTLYAYIGFPLLATIMASTTRRRVMRADRDEPLPRVTVVIPAYNEERNLEARIRNVLDAYYPCHRLEVLVVSDASTDATNDIARSFADEGVHLIVQPRRSGKSAGLNRAIARARGDIVVFTDANAAYSPGVIPTLVGYFSRHEVGLVTGYTRYVAAGSIDVAEATNAYTSLERTIKTAESRWGCCVGADGAVFAMRRSLFRPLRHDDINDLVLPLGVIGQGYECIFAEDAFCTEHPGTSVDSEFRRQARITNRTLRALWRHAHLLNPLRFGVFSFFLFSHKVVRFLVPGFLLVAAASLVALARMDTTYLVAAIALSVAAIVGIVASRIPAAEKAPSLPGRLLRFLGMFLTINAAVLEGWWNFLLGRRDIVWQHDRIKG
jgi:cellulose synthase/poly-beta-1,6-N-acetylglucosamine synthase-like glycosyltransferase